jgi:hypothetical protein
VRSHQQTHQPNRRNLSSVFTIISGRTRTEGRRHWVSGTAPSNLTPKRYPFNKYTDHHRSKIPVRQNPLHLLQQPHQKDPLRRELQHFGAFTPALLMWRDTHLEHLERLETPTEFIEFILGWVVGEEWVAILKQIFWDFWEIFAIESE